MKNFYLSSKIDLQTKLWELDSQHYLLIIVKITIKFFTIYSLLYPKLIFK